MNQLPSDDSRVSPQEFPHVALSRRLFLGGSVLGLGSIAAACLSERESHGDTAPAVTMAPARLPKATAKRVILIFAAGGLSQLDLFDEKPLLNQRRGEELPPSIRKGQRISGVTEAQGALPVVGSAFQFKSYGKSGLRLSELFREMGTLADDLCVVRSMQTDHVLHEAAMSILYTGSLQLGRPSWGSWVSYALGSENQDLPEFVVMLSGTRDGGSPPHPRMWHNGYLPGRHQGCTFRGGSEPVFFVKNPKGVTDGARKSVLERLAELNSLEATRSGDPYVATRIQNYEMAARMQTSVPELADLSGESAATYELYGEEARTRGSFASSALMARRLVERGVRFVQIFHRGWDQHGSLPRDIASQCKDVDRACYGLVQDLKQRGMLDDTLVIWGGEFGRTPVVELPTAGANAGKVNGRDHNHYGFTMWLAGGGVKGGTVYGATDEFGFKAVEKPVHVHDLHATILALLGFDHEKLTYRHAGRDFRLTDVHGKVVRDLIA